MRRFVVLLVILASVFVANTALAYVYSTRMLLNHVIHLEIEEYCAEEGIVVTDEQISTLMEIMASDYNFDNDIVAYDIVIR